MSTIQFPGSAQPTHGRRDPHPTAIEQLATHHETVEACITRWAHDAAADAEAVAGLRAGLAAATVPAAARFHGTGIDPCERWGRNWLKMAAALGEQPMQLDEHARPGLLLPSVPGGTTLAPDMVVLRVDQPEDDGVFDDLHLQAIAWWREEAWLLRIDDHGDGQRWIRLDALRS